MRTKKAFTLIEVVIAVALTMLVLGSIVTIFYQGFRYAKKSKDELVALNLVRGLLEEFSDWDTLDALDDGILFPLPMCEVDGSVLDGTYDNTSSNFCDPLPNVGDSFSDVPLNGTNYSRSLQILPAPYAGDPDSKCKILRATVSWSVAGTPQSITIETCKTNY